MAANVLSFVTLEMGANIFQRKFLFSNQFSDNGTLPERGPLYMFTLFKSNSRHVQLVIMVSSSAKYPSCLLLLVTGTCFRWSVWSILHVCFY